MRLADLRKSNKGVITFEYTKTACALFNNTLLEIRNYVELNEIDLVFSTPKGGEFTTKIYLRGQDKVELFYLIKQEEEFKGVEVVCI